jgi:Protein of unknown function (DUF3048) N-terminal domain/Protein of unknown function (DUF3048) C-terminal domain
VTALGICVAVAGCNSGSRPGSAPARPNPLTGIGTAGRVLAVKIDNVGAAQSQQRGLNGADVVYVEQVEGGLSRYLAVYDSSHPPGQVGPARSARQTDIPILAAYGRVGFGYSGAIPGLLPDLARANLRSITPASGLFSNGGSSPTYIRPAQIFSRYHDLAQARDVGFRFGPRMPGGAPATSAHVAMPAASFTFTRDGARWRIAVDGRLTSLSTTNIIIEHVQVVPGKYTDHNAGHPDNEVFSVTTGGGTADYYRDGRVWHGRWSKPTDASPTRYTVNGSPMLLAAGETYVILVR